jgi:hypothetical protein
MVDCKLAVLVCRHTIHILTHTSNARKVMEKPESDPRVDARRKEGEQRKGEEKIGRYEVTFKAWVRKLTSELIEGGLRLWVRQN